VAYTPRNDIAAALHIAVLALFRAQYGGKAHNFIGTFDFESAIKQAQTKQEQKKTA